MASERADDLKAAPNGNSDAYRTPADQSRFYYMGTPDNLLSRPTPRRTKRHVPDGDKDNKYWEKRKRNNDAARRSRETKRRMDMDVRSRVLLLEEELSLARKELAVIKVKFGLPLDQRFLSTDDNGELVPTQATSLPHMSPPMQTDIRPGMTSDGMPPVDSYSMPTQTANVTSDAQQLRRPTSTSDSRHHMTTPHINTQLDHLGPETQTSPSDNMPVKKRRRGRKEWEESDDQVGEMEDAATASGEAYYGRMLAGSPYPGLLWPSNTPGTQTQFQFPGQMPMMGPAAYQALMDEQQRLPSINAFSNVPVKSEQSREQAPQQQSHHQQQQVHQQQHTQQQPHTQGHTNGTRSDPTTTDDFEYLGPSASNPLPRYYVPYTEGEGSTSTRTTTNLSPADLSLTKGRNHSLELHELSLMKGRHQSQELPDLSLIKGRHQDQELPDLSLIKGRHQGQELPDLSLIKGRHQGQELPDLSLIKGRNHSPELPDLGLAKGRHQSLELPGSEVGDHPARHTHHQQIGVVQPMQGNQQPLQQPQQQQQQQHQQQQQQHQQQQQPQQHQQHLHRSLSSGSEEDEQQERLLVENSDIRNRLQQLTAEVAKMKDYVLKDNVRSTTSGEDQ